MRPYIPPAIFGASDDPDALARAEAVGRAKGRQEGIAEGRARGVAEGAEAARAELGVRIAAMEAELARSASETAMVDALQGLLARRDDDRRAEDEAGRAGLVAALRLAFPALLQAAEGREAAALLQAALQDRPADALVVRAHPDTLDRMCAALPPGTTGPGTRVELAADPALPACAAEITWRGGGLAYDPHALLAGIAAVLQPPGVSVPPLPAPPGSHTPGTEEPIA